MEFRGVLSLRLRSVPLKSHGYVVVVGDAPPSFVSRGRGSTFRDYGKCPNSVFPSSFANSRTVVGDCESANNREVLG